MADTWSLSVIVVSWNSRAYLLPLLRQIEAMRPPTGAVEVIVVDNASHDATADAVAQEFPWVRLLRNTANVGYGAAANGALGACRSDFALLLNPDIELRREPSLWELVSRAGQAEGYGVFGCRLLYRDGQLQSAGEQFPSLARLASLHLGVPRRWRHRSSPVSGLYEADWINGAFMLVRRAVLEHIGLFSDQFFMYGEDLEFCYRARHAGWRVGVFGDYAVTHFQHASVQQCLSSMVVHSARGALKNMSALHGGSLSWPRRVMLRLILSAGAFIRGLVRLPYRPRTALEFFAAGTEILTRLEAN